MTGAELWIGPAIVAAVISGLVSLFVVQLNFRTERRAERLRREEKIRDFQIALRAEIRSERHNLEGYDIAALLLQVRSLYDTQPGYSVVVPRLARHMVFEAILDQIHILPERVIDPVVLYARQRQTIESLIQDIRDSSFKELARDRQLAIYEDYLRMWQAWQEFAAKAEAILHEGIIQ